ncbi:Uncharacterised protein [uncultured archaeon]|nr:Uncharacterised protein [uncultured archaeon]
MVNNGEMPVLAFHGAKIGLSEGQKIRKIDVEGVEALNRQLLAKGSEIKEMQDQLADILNNTRKNKTDYSAGKIEKLTFLKDQDRLFKEKSKTLDDLRLTVRDSEGIIAKVKGLLEQNKME